ncbi:ras-like protein family member 11A-like isoform X1 [Oenanthe melanoleuca]|uniref:ras-like protein family member 11A-like isoform X1 n=1 Tax=Oenanthe melanoleuca TaxID=2939378 RepID=UPI0024C1EBE3|nr:ras-like protein family member 11A-like isoform X1 [Oenanthe melanoleuca]
MLQECPGPLVIGCGMPESVFTGADQKVPSALQGLCLSAGIGCIPREKLPWDERASPGEERRRAEPRCCSPAPARLRQPSPRACCSSLSAPCLSSPPASCCCPSRSILPWTARPTKSSSWWCWEAAAWARQPWLFASSQRDLLGTMKPTRDDTDSICCQEQINRSIYWADGFVFVYSITDYESFRLLRPLHQHIRRIHPNANIPLLLVANKGDLLRARQVSSKEGLQLASELGGTYSEVSAREHGEGVHEAFQQLCQELSRSSSSCNGEKRRGLHLVRPKSPNMQDLKRRLKQALTSKGKSATTL